MLRRHHRFFQSIQVLRDALVVGAAFAVAYVARFSLPHLLPFGAVSDANETWLIGVLLVVLWPMVGWVGGLYVSQRTRGLLRDIYDVFKTCGLVFLVLVTLTYFLRDARYSRGVLLLWLVLAFVGVAAARVASRVVLWRLRAKGYNLRHVMVVGTSGLAERVVRTVQSQAHLGLRAVAVVAQDEADAPAGGTLLGVPVVGYLAQLKSVLGRYRQVDQIIVALPLEQLQQLGAIMAVLSQETVDVRLVPDLHQYVTLCGGIEELHGLPMINLQSTPLLGWNLVLKRSFDLLVASVGLALTLPVMLAVAVTIRLADRGPIFFRQQRVGMDGRPFCMYKFRTMRLDAESRGERMTTAKDPRRTPVGVWLRRSSLDELPQLWNVIKGDMSLVGPRPEQPRFIEEFKRDIPRYALRHKIKAGMTGWAQVQGMRGNTSIARRIELDLYYIENWSLLFDLKILLRTVCGGFLSPNAY